MAKAKSSLKHLNRGIVDTIVLLVHLAGLVSNYATTISLVKLALVTFVNLYPEPRGRGFSLHCHR